MSAIFAPIALGLIAFVSAGIGLWFLVALLLIPWLETGVALLPALVLIPSLTIGGFVAGGKTRTAGLAWKIVMGAVVGILSMAVFFLISRSAGIAWFFLLLMLGGGSLGAFGALISAKVGHAP